MPPPTVKLKGRISNKIWNKKDQIKLRNLAEIRDLLLGVLWEGWLGE